MTNIKLEEIPEIDNLRKWALARYYERYDVLFEITKQTQRRETAFLIPSWITDPTIRKRSLRFLRIHSPQYLQRAFRSLRYLTYDNIVYFNIYKSVATYKDGLPFTSLKLDQRDTTQWKTDAVKHIIAYDFFLDIDAGDHNDIKHAHKSASMIIKLLNTWDVPYSLIFSGCGFHIIIPYKYFEEYKYSFDPKNENNIYKQFHKIAKYFYDMYSEMVDLGIYDSKRLCKIPYSLSHYLNRSYVSWAYNDLNEFDKFVLNDFELKNFIGNFNIRNRVIHVFNKNGNVDILLKNVEVYFNGIKKTTISNR